jgi:metallo-beta-lactamase class B
MRHLHPLGLLVLVAAFAQAPQPFKADPPMVCASCDEWNQPRPPFKIYGNSYYVGSGGLSAVLVTSPGGHILLDGGLPQTAPMIDAGIRKLGFRTEDIRVIVNSHAHYDHAGGIAALRRASGAIVAASRSGARALEQGGPTTDDPQYAFGPKANDYPPAGKDPRQHELDLEIL